MWEEIGVHYKSPPITVDGTIDTTAYAEMLRRALFEHPYCEMSHTAAGSLDRLTRYPIFVVHGPPILLTSVPLNVSDHLCRID
jgi:hypothetical protein